VVDLVYEVENLELIRERVILGNINRDSLNKEIGTVKSSGCLQLQIAKYNGS